MSQDGKTLHDVILECLDAWALSADHPLMSEVLDRAGIEKGRDRERIVQLVSIIRHGAVHSDVTDHWIQKVLEDKEACTCSILTLVEFMAEPTIDSAAIWMLVHGYDKASRDTVNSNLHLQYHLMMWFTIGLISLMSQTLPELLCTEGERGNG